MKTKKIILLLWAIATWIPGITKAIPRSEQQARAIAEKFLKAKFSTMKRTVDRLTLAATSEILDAPEKRTDHTQVPAWYVYNQEDEAFVIVSGDDRIKDILGYSTENSFATENLPENLRTWLQAYTALAHAAPTASTANLRDLTSTYPAAVSPLLGNINYNQNEPYNRKCPMLNGNRCVTGCTPTAMASILSYWKYPTHGDGSVLYTTDRYGLQCSFNFENTPFDWENILPTYATETYTENQAEAIATLIYACGVAAETDYGTEASSTSIQKALEGLINHFGINPYTCILPRTGFSSQEWMECLKGEISAGRPVLYAGNDQYDVGHHFVIDGYDTEEMVHVNWGWGGLSNGYFEILSLNPDFIGIGGGVEGGYAFEQTMFCNLAPEYMLSTPMSFFQIGSLRFDNRTAYITDIYNNGYEFDGTIGIIAEQNGTSHLLGKMNISQTIETGYGYSTLQIQLDDLQNLQAGTYTVYAASKLAEETEWSKARGVDTEYMLTVGSGQTYTFRPTYDTTFPIATLSTESPLYPNAYVNFDIRIRNEQTDRETLGELYLVLNGPNVEQRFIYRDQILLATGEERVLTRCIQLPDLTGNYTLTPYWTCGNSTEAIGPDLNLDILQGISTNDIALQNCTLDRTSYESGSWITCNGEAYLKDSDADFFTGELYYGVFPANGGYALTGKYVPFTIAQNSPASFSEQLKADLQPGNYLFIVMETWGTQETLWNTSFSVTEASYIEGNLTDASYEKPVLLSATGSTDLCFRYAENVKMARLYNLTGQSVGDIHALKHNRDTYRIPIQDLPKGGYILKLVTERGKTETLKFIK